jgi:hypothetical protein
MFLLNQ